MVVEHDSHPSYYLISEGLEAMDVIDALGLNFNLGCVVKYVVRQGRKPNAPALTDLRKARDCLDREIQRMEAENGQA